MESQIEYIQVNKKELLEFAEMFEAFQNKYFGENNKLNYAGGQNEKLEY
jgi:hypothetical protein